VVQGCHQHAAAQQGLRTWLQATGGQAGLLLQRPTQQQRNQNIETRKTCFWHTAQSSRAGITSSLWHGKRTTALDLPTQHTASPAAACKHNHTFCVSLEAAQQRQNLLIPAVLNCEEGQT
jgi:hypothetical protein